MCVPFLALAAIGGWYYFQEPSYHFLIPLSSGVIGLTGTLLYYAKWSNRWFREHADAELQARNYKADMLRASWLAELVSEWASDGKAPPTDILEVFSRNLFQASASTDVEHPVDSLLGLLRRAQRLDVAKDHVTIEAGAKESK